MFTVMRVGLQSVVFLGWLLGSVALPAADRILLRNLEILRDCEVVSFDADGLILAAERSSGGKLVTWDEVETLQLTVKQAEANQLLAEIGPALFAIQRRLTTGDDEALRAPAEQLWPLFRERQGKSACLVALALMWGRLAHGAREQAVEPWFKAYDLLRNRALKLSEIPGKRKVLLDAATAIHWELEPVWFDTAAAKKALPLVDKCVAQMTEPVPEGAKLYLASLALAAGEMTTAEALLDETYQQAKSKTLQQILLLQQACLLGKPAASRSEFEATLASVPKDMQPLALYWLGQSYLVGAADSTQPEEALVMLLRIPALHARHSPDLAAAALFTTLEHYRQDRKLTARLQQELVEKFPFTFHGRKLRGK
jgi:hypothetical protein